MRMPPVMGLRRPSPAPPPLECADPLRRPSLPALMNQTRLFLIFAWLMVATLLWMEWGKEKAAPATPQTTTAETAAATPTTQVPNANAIPAAPGAPVAAPAPTATVAPAQR